MLQQKFFGIKTLLICDKVFAMIELEQEWLKGRSSLGAAAKWTADEIRLVAEIGYALADQGRIEEAISLFEGLTQDYNKTAHAQSYFGRATAKQSKGLIKESLIDFDKALEIYPNSIETLINRGVAKQTLGDSKGAIADYSKAIEIFPKNAIAFLNRGMALENTDINAAITDYTKVIELDPKQSQAFVRRALLYLKQKKKREAVQDFDRAFLLEPSLKTEYKGFYVDAKKP